MSDEQVTVEELSGGGYVASGSWKDLMAFEQANQAAALEGLVPVQRELLDGRAFCWFSWNGSIELACFGEVDSVQDASAKEKALSGPEDGPPFDYAENRARGFATSTTYSTWEPGGEMGDVHLLELVPIAAYEFEVAWECEWDMTTLAHEHYEVFASITTAWNDVVTQKATKRRV